jgi:hypothetical protein
LKTLALNAKNFCDEEKAGKQTCDCPEDLRMKVEISQERRNDSGDRDDKTASDVRR